MTTLAIINPKIIIQFFMVISLSIENTKNPQVKPDNHKRSQKKVNQLTPLYLALT